MNARPLTATQVVLASVIGALGCLVALQTPAAGVSVLRGETVRCDATASEGHPVWFQWRVTNPDGQPVPVEPGVVGIVDITMDTAGQWQIGVDALYAHTVGKVPWTSSFDGTVDVTSVIAALVSAPAGNPLQIPVSSDFTLDGTASRFGQGTEIEATWTYSDGGAWYTLSECADATGSVANPSDLTCAVTGSYLGAGDWTLRLQLEDTTSGDTASADVAVVVTDFQAEFHWDPQHPDPGAAVNFIPDLPGGYSTSDLDHVTWTWGDGEVFVDTCGFPFYCSQYPHVYEYAGVYTVTAEIETLSGEIDTISHTITIGTPPAAPTAAFTVDLDQTEVPAQATLAFTGSCEAPCSYTWFFGDGGSASGIGEPTPQIRTYTTAGDYTIRLEVSNTTDSDASEQLISLTVPPPPNTIFSDGFEDGTSHWSGVVSGT